MEKNIKITCPKCNHSFNIEEVLGNQIHEEYKKKFEKMQSDLLTEAQKKEETIKRREQELLSQKEEIEKVIQLRVKDKNSEILKEYEIKMKEMQKQVSIKESELTQKSNEIFKKETEIDKVVQSKLKDEKSKMLLEVKNSMKDEYEIKIQSLNQENEERKKQTLEWKRKEVEFQRKFNEMDEMKVNLELEYQKKHQEDRRILEESIRRREHESTELKLKEKDKQLDDQKKRIEDLLKKAEQGSMQLQGEIQELALEDILKTEFKFDLIEEVAKGIKGADIIHTVRNKQNQNCGIILYESKRTKSFGNDWIPKLKEDAQRVKANILVIVSETLPNGMDKINFTDGVWICTFHEVKGLVLALRESLIKLSEAQSAQTNKGEKMQMLYDYLTSDEFKMQIEGIIEGYHNLHQSITKEKLMMEKIWKEREKQLEKVLLNATHFYGSVKGIAGTSIPDLKLLDGEA